MQRRYRGIQAFKIPQRNVNPGQSTHHNRSTPIESKSVYELPYMFDVTAGMNLLARVCLKII
jgi:hypothetical protein